MLIESDAAVRDDMAKVIGFVDKPAEGLHLSSICAGRRFSAASGKSPVRSRPGGR
jgi:hypothetical protein